jgi:hypothetical protein
MVPSTEVTPSATPDMPITLPIRAVDWDARPAMPPMQSTPDAKLSAGPSCCPANSDAP